MKSSKQRYTLDQLFSMLNWHWVEGAHKHIIYNPHLVPQYRIIRQQAHDGTSIFTWEMVQKAMWVLASQNSFYGPDGPPPEGFHMEYEVGTTKLFSMFGTVDINGNKMWGQRQRLIIPVRSKFVED
jgi:hypothetical protein